MRQACTLELVHNDAQRGLVSCSGNIKAEPGAVVCRVSPSFVRFGTFQLPASRGGLEADLVGVMADFIIDNHYPHLKGKCRLALGHVSADCAWTHAKVQAIKPSCRRNRAKMGNACLCQLPLCSPMLNCAATAVKHHFLGIGHISQVCI